MKKNCASYITLLLLLFFCISCENEEGVVGSSIIVNENHNIVSYPTDEAASFFRYANILASETDIGLLGDYVDPVFNNQRGSCAFQIRPDDLINGTIISISEISLEIPYIGFYADESITADMINDMSIKVSKVANTLNDNALYTHQLSSFEYEEACVLDNINMSSIESTGYLTLNLIDCPSIVELISSALLNSNNENLNTFQSEFLNNFHGIHLSQNPSLGVKGMMMLNINNAIIDVKYNNDISDNTLQFNIGSTLTFLGNPYNYPISIGDPPSYKIFLQSMGGAYSEINMQFLTDLKEEGYIAVNDAELILHISEENGNFPLPDNLRLYQFADNEAIDFANATPIAESDNVNTENQTYMFDMTTLIHETINGEREPIFQLYLNSPTSEMNRLVLDNPFELNLLLIKEDN